jgi:hypothetical protein
MQCTSSTVAAPATPLRAGAVPPAAPTGVSARSSAGSRRGLSTAPGAHWLTRPTADYPRTSVSRRTTVVVLGMAHGMAGLLPVLADGASRHRTLSRAVASTARGGSSVSRRDRRAVSLSSGALRWATVRPARFKWCNGDRGSRCRGAAFGSAAPGSRAWSFCRPGPPSSRGRRGAWTVLKGRRAWPDLSDPRPGDRESFRPASGRGGVRARPQAGASTGWQPRLRASRGCARVRQRALDPTTVVVLGDGPGSVTRPGLTDLTTGPTSW